MILIHNIWVLCYTSRWIEEARCFSYDVIHLWLLSQRHICTWEREVNCSLLATIIKVHTFVDIQNQLLSYKTNLSIHKSAHLSTFKISHFYNTTNLSHLIRKYRFFKFWKFISIFGFGIFTWKSSGTTCFGISVLFPSTRLE